MSLLDRLEKRYGGYALPNVTLWLIAGQAMVFVAQYLQPGVAAGEAAAEIFGRLTLDPRLVYAGEYWRLVTFMFLAPLGIFPLFVLLFWWFFYFMGSTLENSWGVFRFNAFLTVGYLATIAASFLADAIQPGAGVGVGDFLFGSVFLAFAKLYPDFTIYLFLILPVKIKWLAWLQWLGYGFVMLFGDWYSRLMATAAVMNYLVFFGKSILRDVRLGKKRLVQQSKTLQAPAKIIHECLVCGLSNDAAPRTAFRYCSQCEGQCCYCPDHIRDHEHVVAGA